MRSTAFLALTFLAFLDLGKGTALASEERTLARKAKHILKANCHRCHGKDGTNEGGFNYVVDLEKLVARNKVVPGQAAKSRLFKRLSNADDPMPPADEKPRPSKDDLALLRQWIDAGAPAVEKGMQQRHFLASADVLRLIQEDLDRVNERDRRFTRYFTLTHLYNAGFADEELQSYRHGLAKLVNSLSWGGRIVVPRPVDPARTVFRIDLRDYQWNENVWDAILDVNPYGVVHPSETARTCAAVTRCKLPYVRADWFVAAASRPPLYHEVLQLPPTERALERLLRVEVAEDIRLEKVARAGFNGSGVSRNNRLIERHESGGVVYWKSYDFGGNVGRQNLFAHPLGPGDGASDFHQDGGEIIFTLPNGLHAYLLVDAAGKRLDKGPTTIVTDPRRPDRAVENGISCMSCHARGMIEKNDQVRAHVLRNPGAFARSDREAALALYPRRDSFAALLREDARRFQVAVEKTGAPLSVSEPVVTLTQRFEAELDLPVAAAEAGVRPADLLLALERTPRLAQRLGPLRVEGGTIQRQVFVNAFPELVRALRLGNYLKPRNSPYARALARGDDLLGKGEAATAVQAYSAAVALDPENPLAHLRRGEAHRAARDLGRAISDFTEAIRLDPQLTLAYHGRAAASHDRREFDRAISDYGEVLRLDPRDAVACNNRGLAYFDKGDFARAIADYDEALRLDPNYAIALHNRGLAHHRKGAPDRAIADFTEALRRDSHYVLAYHHRAAVLHEQGDYDRALADYDEVLRLNPRFAVAWNNRGLTHYERRAFDRAVADFTEAIRLDAKLAQAYFNRANAYRALGDVDRAAADRATAVRLEPTLSKD